MFYYDSTYILVLAALALSLIAQGMVSSAYKKYEKIQTRKGLPAARVADEILRQNGNQAVSVRPVPGKLTDHYDPRNETLSLSEGVYNSASIAAVGIAAHEAGHAMQKQEGYALIPLSVYFKNSRVKVELGLCKGKKTYDKREAVAKRDAKREMDRAMREKNRGY